MTRNTERLLSQAGIEGYETIVVPYATCRACSICPPYAAMHTALIKQSQVAKATTLGFESIEPP